MMSAFDLSPLFRSTIGFDRLMRLADAATRLDATAASYPPYNIENTGDDSCRLTMAVAGFSIADLEIVVQENALVISGKAKKDEENARYLYRGIARRAFERRFQLADHIKVVGASLDNGLLHVELAREVPETAKPRTIQIATGAPEEKKPEVLEQQRAA